MNDQHSPDQHGPDQHGPDQHGPDTADQGNAADLGNTAEQGAHLEQGEHGDVEHTLQLPADTGQQPPADTAAPGGPDPYAPQSGTPSYGPSVGFRDGRAGHDGPGGPQAGMYQGGSYGQPPAQGQALPPYAGYGQPPMAPVRERRAKVSRGVWPAVAALSLVIGLLGGAVGGYAVDRWQNQSDVPGRTSNGLADVDTVMTAPLPADNGSIASVATKLLPSTVQIRADFKGEEGGASGSGFFLDKQGHVVTNNHVVADAADGGKITVVDHQNNRYPATVVGRSPVYDLAVLYVEGLTGVQPASLGSSENLRVGENVVAIGSPLGLSSTVTSGIVSALDRPVTTGASQDSQSYINAVQTDAAINPGNSGGPLVNLAGQVVGVNSAIATTSGSSMGQESGNIGVGFAIPIEQVKVTADQILKDGEARYPVIGATVSSDGSGDGARIQDVEDNSPAAKGGLKEDDIVTSLDDRIVTDSPTLIVAIRSHVSGETVSLTVKRGGAEKTVKLTLDSKVG